MVENIMLTGDNRGPIAPENTYAMDETRFQPNGGEGVDYVLSVKGKKFQYQQQSGSRENITVLVTIAGDGHALRPMVLYSGRAFQSSWIQVSNTSETREIANGHIRILWVDSHGSHLTYALLDFTACHGITITCYPP
ncbi:hypothetical protein FA15DRAFT_739558 [Coprinopsis marcescibilis]|uniref:DDE-1 domain-containing protein n=1 Tax=Coprinopsis marcescibilis TaxID=230819 RepID=A0A5C3KWH4_COPMA|nr:hypothetical protein FA15DRAFT_739558 [Coprinopsis marcescibilis]